MTYMYKGAKTWNPLQGCRFNCIYCKGSFKAQAKRQKHNCILCYNYEPHFHPERLNKIPNADLIFACGNGDISFAEPLEKAQILRAIQHHPKKTFLVQTKNPRCLWDWRIPSNVIVGTTIETDLYPQKISDAPIPSVRYLDLLKMNCRKAVTIEPILDFDLKTLKHWVWKLNPEIVWVGYANHTKNLKLIEPELSKTRELIKQLESFTDVRVKTLRERMEVN